MASAEEPNDSAGVQPPIHDEGPGNLAAGGAEDSDGQEPRSGDPDPESPPPFDAGEYEPPGAGESDSDVVASGGLGIASGDDPGGGDESVEMAETTIGPGESGLVASSVGSATSRNVAGAAPEVDVEDSDTWMTSGAGHPRRWAVLGVLVVSLLVVVLDNTVLNIALPTIQAELNASQSQLVWAVDSYILVFAALLFTWGIVGDRYGRKKILILGLLIFVSASIASAFALSPTMLIGTRALMGIGGAAVMPVTLAIITVVFPPHERGKAIGVWAGSVGAAVALGPVLGGLLLEHPEWSQWLTNNGWGSVFLINVPIVAVGLVGIWRIVPESRNPEPQKLDLIGLVLSFVGLALLIFGIVNSSVEKSWVAPGVVVPVVLGVLIIAAFLVYEAKSDHKSFDVGLFRNRGYAVSLSAVSLTFFAMTGITFSLPFYFQILRGMTTLQAGLSFLPFALGQFIAAPQSARLVDRFGYRKVMATGLTLVALALAGLTRLEIESSLALILVSFFFFGLGMGMVIAPATSLMQNVLPLARAGAGSAVQNTVRQVFGALGIAIVGTIIGAQYAKNVAGRFAPLGPDFPADQAAESVVATDRILSGAEEQGAPGEVVEQVRQVAYDTFLDAAHVTMTIAAGVVVIALVLVVFVLPYIRPPSVGDAAPRDTWDEPEEVTQHEIAIEQGLADPESPEPSQPARSDTGAEPKRE